ncbi:MAG: hypothetical protein ACXWQO_13075 [Bdellovibrionota bacterium]
MGFLLLFLLSSAAFAEDAPALRAMILTCDEQYLPQPGQAYLYEPHRAEVSGILIGSIKEVDKLVKPATYYGGGFVEYDKSLPCAILKDTHYQATIWNPNKTKVWCAVYDGVFASPRDCEQVKPEEEKK